MGSSWTWGQAHVPCIGRQILNHCATREACCHLFMDWLDDFLKSKLLISKKLKIGPKISLKNGQRILDIFPKICRWPKDTQKSAQITSVWLGGLSLSGHTCVTSTQLQKQNVSSPSEVPLSSRPLTTALKDDLLPDLNTIDSISYFKTLYRWFCMQCELFSCLAAFAQHCW